MVKRPGTAPTPAAAAARVAGAARRPERRARGLAGGAARPERRALGLAAAAALLAAGALSHALVYPRTFNGRPPAAVRVDPTSRAALSRGDDPPRAASAAAARARVALVVVDGLRDDAAAGLGLAGAPGRDGRPAAITRCTIEAGWPAYSRASYATLGTGAPPVLTGVHTNRFRGGVELDSVFVRARAAGLRVVAVTDDVTWWGEMFPGGFEDHQASFAAFTDATARAFGPDAGTGDARGAFGPDAGAGGAGDAGGAGGARGAAAAWIALGGGGAAARDTGFDVALLHTVIVDSAGHASGAASTAYRDAVSETGVWLRAMLARLDPARDTLVVVSDHGHLDRGGHGGPEPVVLRVPLFLAGRGARAVAPARCPAATTMDVAPTLAALAGVAPPRHAVGRALVELLDLPAEELAAAEALGRARRAALAVALGGSAADGERALASVLPRPRAPAALPLAGAAAGWLVLCAALVALAGGGARPGARAALALVYPLAAAAVLVAIEPISFSAVRAGSAEYAARLLVLLAAPALLGLAAQLAAWRGAPGEDAGAGLRVRALGLAAATAPWLLAIGLHGSATAGPELGDPHVSFAVLLGAAVAAVGAASLALLLVADVFRLGFNADPPAPPAGR